LAGNADYKDKPVRLQDILHIITESQKPCKSRALAENEKIFASIVISLLHLKIVWAI